ncbi:hypothetical protein V6N13_008898 [Hibiscus sabdariffa]|uniref:Glycine-rich protein n=1 Tax=Hibiscus sabdariffa TaxID=183260 RepID=A0ABR2NQT9_9ROSI
MGKILSAKKPANMVLIIMVIGIVLALMTPSALGKGGGGRGGGFGGRGGGFGGKGGGPGRRGGVWSMNGSHAWGHSSSSAAALDTGCAFGFVQLMPFAFSVLFFV